jgi:hypothetical protein
MRFCNQQDRYYCGIDVHARSMFIHILDAQGQTRFEQDQPACPDASGSAVAQPGLLRQQKTPRGRPQAEPSRCIQS